MNKSEENNTPIPQGNYLAAARFGNVIHTAGMTPRDNGVLIQRGKIRADQPAGMYQAAIRQAAANALAAVRNLLLEGEEIGQIVSLTVYLNAEDPFEAHSSMADFASAYLCEQLGDAGIGPRAAVGVASLPGGAPVEIQLVAGVAAER